MHRCLPLLKNRRKLVFLSFTNVNPHKLLPWLLLLDDVTKPRMEMQCIILKD
jgi:hypothetical protein